MDYEVRYARSGKVNIAWTTVGSKPIDLLLVPGALSHIDLQMKIPQFAEFLERLCTFCRVILMDKRGMGLSDRDVGESTLEARMDDLRAVLDAAGAERAAVVAISEGGPLGILMAATYPERVRALVLAGSLSTPPPEEIPAADVAAAQKLVAAAKTAWGQGSTAELWGQSWAQHRNLIAQLERAAVSPGALLATLQWASRLNVRAVAQSLKVPVLVWHRTDDAVINVENGRWLARNIPGARYLEEAGDEHLPFIDSARFVDEVRALLTGSRDEIIVDRILATAVFTDIVGSTALAAKHGDQAWTRILRQHRGIVREQLARYRGQEIDDAGDGFFAVFDGPARAIQCAARIRDAMETLGVQVRVGVHTGECERSGAKYAGIAVHTAARVMSLAQPGEVLVSRTVRDLVAGSGLTFEERGVHELKGVPGRWELFAAKA